jgi:uncharacterized protein (TIGR00369 family)
MGILPSYRTSFFAGQERQDGLKLTFKYRRGIVYTDIMIAPAFQGFENVVHGGMLFGILDTMIWYAICMEIGKSCMTRKTDMDFLKPVLCGTLYRAQAKVLRVEDRDVWSTAWIEDAQKERYAQVTALFREGKGVDYSKLIERLDFTGVPAEVKEMFLASTRQENESPGKGS